MYIQPQTLSWTFHVEFNPIDADSGRVSPLHDPPSLMDNIGKKINQPHGYCPMKEGMRNVDAIHPGASIRTDPTLLSKGLNFPVNIQPRP